MDRHQFVKELIAKRDTLEEKTADLRRQIGKANARTKEAVLGFSGNSLSVIGYGAGTITGSFPPQIPEAERVSDEAIQSLCIEIGKLESDIPSLQKELEHLKAQDFVGHLKSLLSM